MKREKLSKKEKILKYLSDGREHHYTEIASKLNINPSTVLYILHVEKKKNIVITPTQLISKSLVGFYKLNE